MFGGFQKAQGKYSIIADLDDSYDFLDLNKFVLKLREGYDLVMGNRFKSGIKKGAIPFLHRDLGNPILSFIGRLFFNIKIGDFYCGLRGFTKEAIMKMGLTTTGMEFASEIVVRASINIFGRIKNNGNLYTHLCREGKTYRKRGVRKDSRGIIKSRIRIEQRPELLKIVRVLEI